MTVEKLQVRDITEREIQVIELLAEGLTNSEIADRLFLSKNTIKWYVQKLNQKLFTDGREGIVEEALRLGLLGLYLEGDIGPIRTNLPHQTTPFVGRERELIQLRQILDNSDNRLITILAPGGMGKTRLALELAHQQLTQHVDGVYFVPLQTIRSQQDVCAHIANSIGFQQGVQGDNLKQVLFQVLGGKSMLLLLDNFEQVRDGTTFVNELLQAAPEIRLVITTRERLNLLGETIYTVGGLHFSESNSLDDMLKVDAVQLIQQVAQRIRPEWEVTPANVHSVNQLCQLTQGMPLAILLAISWLDVYTIERICEEIQMNLDILSTEIADVPSRQRSIQAVFDHTWERLTKAEREVLMKISVFRDGCTTDALESVTQATPRVLRGLVMKALINRLHSGRYQIHELLRQYAEKKLDDAGAVHQVRLTHATYYLDLVSNQSEKLKTHRQITALNLMSAEWENVRAAWQTAIEYNATEIIDRSLEALRLTMLLMNRMDRYSIWLNNALDSLPLSDRDSLFFKLSVYKADALIVQTLTEQSYQLLKSMEKDIEVSDDLMVKSLASVTLSRASYILSDPESSLNYAQMYLEMSRELGDLWHEAQAHYAYALIVGLWDADAPLHHIEHCLELSRRSGDRYWLSQGYVLGGLMLSRLGRINEALTYTEKGYDVANELNDKHTMSAALANLSTLVLAQGDWERAGTLQIRALKLEEERGHTSNELLTVTIKLSEYHLLQGDLQNAEYYLNRVWQRLDLIEYPAIPSRYYTQKSMIAEYQGLFDEAHQLALKATGYIKTNMNWSIVHNALQRLTWTYCCTDDFANVNPYLIQITRQELQSNRPWNMLRVVALLSLFVAYKGQLERAATMIGFVDQHNIQSTWLQEHPKLMTLRQTLRHELDDGKYDAAWQLGNTLDVRNILIAWLREFDPDYSDTSNAS
ncbi:MAG: LuxR C-terminal-related transcriptional regulator [Anaerolineae bacterium]